MNIKNHIISIGCSICLLCVPSRFFTEEFHIKNVEFTGITASNATIPITYKKQLESKEFTSGLAQELIASLYATDEVDQVKLFKREDGTLVVSCVPKPRIVAVDVEGRSPFGSHRPDLEESFKEFLDRSGIQPGAKFNQNLIENLCAQYRLEYESIGVHDLSVHVQVIPIAKKSSVRLRISVIMGDPASLKRVSILGNSKLSKDVLHEALSMNRSPFFRDPLVNLFISGGFSSEQVLYEKNALESCYRQHGYLKPELSLPIIELSPSKDGIYVTYTVEDEGPKFFWKNIEIVSADEKTAELVKNFSFKNLKGQAVNYEDVEILKERLKEIFTAQGYRHAEISEQKDEDIENRTVTLKLYCRCGERTYIRNVFIKDEAGLALPYYLKILTTTSGSLSAAAGIQSDYRRLQAMPCVETAHVKPIDVEGHDHLIDLVYSTLPNTARDKNGLEFRSQSWKEIALNVAFNRTNWAASGRELGLESDITLNFSEFVGHKKDFVDGNGWLPSWGSFHPSLKGSAKFSFNDPVSFAPLLTYQFMLGSRPESLKKLANIFTMDGFLGCHFKSELDVSLSPTYKGYAVGFGASGEPTSIALQFAPLPHPLKNNTEIKNAGANSRFFQAPFFTECYTYLSSWQQFSKALRKKTFTPETLQESFLNACAASVQLHTSRNPELPVCDIRFTPLNVMNYGLDTKLFPSAGTNFSVQGVVQMRKNFNCPHAEAFSHQLTHSSWLKLKMQSFDLGPKLFGRNFKKYAMLRTDLGFTYPLWANRPVTSGSYEMGATLVEGTFADLGFGRHASMLSYPHPIFNTACSPKGRLGDLCSYHFSKAEFGSRVNGGLGFLSFGMNAFNYWLPEAFRKIVRLYFVGTGILGLPNSFQRDLVKAYDLYKFSEDQQGWINDQKNAALMENYRRAKMGLLLGLRVFINFNLPIIPPIHLLIGYHLSPLLNNLFVPGVVQKNSGKSFKWTDTVNNFVKFCDLEDLDGSSFVVDGQLLATSQFLG